MMFVKQEERKLVNDLLAARRYIRALRIGLTISSMFTIAAVISTIAMYERMCQ